MEHKFFVKIKAEDFPRTTAQQKKFSTKTKRFYETKKTNLAKAQIDRALSGRQPAIELTVYWVFPKIKRAKNGQRKDTSPDLDNLQKTLQDRLAKLKFYENDALISDLILKKRWHDCSGLYIKIRDVEPIDEEINEMLEEIK